MRDVFFAFPLLIAADCFGKSSLEIDSQHTNDYRVQTRLRNRVATRYAEHSRVLCNFM